ncbi:DUF1573 domain-containing protein [Crocinitomix catalasitica]|nr:DUF1573 domain-containing protein [Crocinitomix catalasitica]
MKKSLLILSIFSLLFLGINVATHAQSETKVEGTPAETSDGPIIKVDKKVHDYGTIDQGADGKCVFIVSNEGTQPLVISLCKGSCGCTVPVCPKEPIAPGESKEITVKYNTNRVGAINKNVTITSNAVNEPRMRIDIKGNVKAKPSGGAPINTGTPTND